MTGRANDNILTLASIKPNLVSIIDYTPIEEIAAKCDA